MTIYILPIVADRKYSGKYPTRVHSVSYTGDQRDIDGKPFVLLELNNGTRFTATRDCLMDTTRMPELGRCVTDTVRGTVRAMHDDEYAAWLELERKRRAALNTVWSN